MDPELVLVFGLVITALAIPSLINAFSRSRVPKAAVLMFMVGGGLMVWGIRSVDGKFEMQDIPDLFVRVIGSFFG